MSCKNDLELKNCSVQGSHCQMVHRSGSTLERNPDWNLHCTNAAGSKSTHTLPQVPLFHCIAPSTKPNSRLYIPWPAFHLPRCRFCSGGGHRCSCCQCMFRLFDFVRTDQMNMVGHFGFDSDSTAGNNLEVNDGQFIMKITLLTSVSYAFSALTSEVFIIPCQRTNRKRLRNVVCSIIWPKILGNKQTNKQTNTHISS